MTQQGPSTHGPIHSHGLPPVEGVEACNAIQKERNFRVVYLLATTTETHQPSEQLARQGVGILEDLTATQSQSNGEPLHEHILVAHFGGHQLGIGTEAVNVIPSLHKPIEVQHFGTCVVDATGCHQV